ncbi:MAG: CinA family protein [Deltaproteobacteria bacterium]|nr:CinA family protein [Deltaproteobacteria bacterium]
MGVASYRIKAAAIGRLLKEKGLSLGVAESCTGGLLSCRITDVPGASAYFRGGIVAYDNAVKIDALGVAASTIAAYGAVSRQCCMEMAEGARLRLGTDAGAAITGIAGPDGGTRRKPVGTVFVGVSMRGRVRVKRFFFGGGRLSVKRRSAQAALEMIETALTGYR